MLSHIKKSIFIFIFTSIGLYADYNTGKKIFEQKCSSCHGGFIARKVLEDNFLKQDNKILKLTSPTVNMITYFLIEDSNHIGDKNDPEMQKIEIEEFIKDYVYQPNRINSIIRDEFLKYFDVKKSMKGKVSKDEISNIVDYLFDYKEKREKNQKKSKLKSMSIDKVLSEAKKDNKLIIIEAMSKTCYYCEKMEKNVLSKPDIIRAINKNFLFIKIDVNEKELPLSLQKHYKKLTPSFFVINADGKLLNSYPGSWTKEDFFEIMKENLK